MSDDDFLGDLGTSKVRPGELSALAQSDMITTHTHQGFDTKFKCIIDSLRRRELAGSYRVAIATAEVMKVVVSSSRWTSAQTVIERVKEIGKLLISAAPLELTIGNVVRRVLSIIREEYLACQYQENQEEGSEEIARVLDPHSSPALYKMLGHDRDEVYTEPYDIKAVVQTSVGELIDEINNLYRNISDQTVAEFLIAAARKRKFDVIVAQSAPSYTGNETAASLSRAGIETTIIPDSAIFAMMARTNKVILGTHAVLANGGLIAFTGSHAVALAAKHHAVPVVVCMGLYKLCPLYPTAEQDSFNCYNPPGSIMPFEETTDIDQLHVESPAYDYVPPELVSLFVTNVGGHSPSYIYRLLAEYYHPADYVL
ncbi:translation initiation factor eif2b subunit beta, putative [Acanthamoeba castellanii str. Neff]|uniref:Translation initiation factor eIF2B subunit beta n=1 Tax=Acanthamoeba castellanii (strain ATCC 30010 / Neff) TaxID=1257118 RepID=L8GQT6_ACACF|nr:translation initiation factor eif2b subunit beta, putative [Acanthamoeba castellanii str. Neff]ELR14496.1 translation initiation factor eif2b subunit beta, putative [Acanthamoeba castellanii str. Neff]